MSAATQEATAPGFEGFDRPNYTKQPNSLVDTLLRTLSGSEVKCLLVILRRTTGYRKDSDTIGFAEFSTLTGLSRRAVVTALARLEAHGVISVERVGELGGHRRTNAYELRWRGDPVTDTLANGGADGGSAKNAPGEVVQKVHYPSAKNALPLVQKLHQVIPIERNKKKTLKKGAATPPLAGRDWVHEATESEGDAKRGTALLVDLYREHFPDRPSPPVGRLIHGSNQFGLLPMVEALLAAYGRQVMGEPLDYAAKMLAAARRRESGGSAGRGPRSQRRGAADERDQAMAEARERGHDPNGVPTPEAMDALWHAPLAPSGCAVWDAAREQFRAEDGERSWMYAANGRTGSFHEVIEPLEFVDFDGQTLRLRCHSRDHREGLRRHEQRLGVAVQTAAQLLAEWHEVDGHDVQDQVPPISVEILDAPPQRRRRSS